MQSTSSASPPGAQNIISSEMRLALVHRRILPTPPGCNLYALIGGRLTLMLTWPVNQTRIQRMIWLTKDQLESADRWDRCRRNAGLVLTDAT